MSKKMNKVISFLISLSIMIFPTLAIGDVMTTQYTSKNQQTLQPADSNHFTGNASFSRLPSMPSNGDIVPAMVYFKPNSFTDWHSHSQGQYLIVTEGTGRFQEWGKPIQIITKGDVIWIAPNVKHWHGAGEFTSMTHIAISPVKDNQVTWLEKVVPEKTERLVNIDKILNNQFTTKQLAIVPLAIAITEGNQTEEKLTIENSLHVGLTVNELKAIISHQFAYIGAPKTLNGMIIFKSIIEERANQGINDLQGNQATDLGMVDYYQLGEQKLAALTNRPTATPLFDFAPSIDYSIKAQLFGYQFSRDNLGDVERELATIGSLLGLGESVNAQLHSHLSVLKNLGLTENSVNQIMDVITPQQAKNLSVVWADVNK